MKVEEIHDKRLHVNVPVDDSSKMEPFDTFLQDVMQGLHNEQCGEGLQQLERFPSLDPDVSVDDILGSASAGGGLSTIVPKIEPASWHYGLLGTEHSLPHVCSLNVFVLWRSSSSWIWLTLLFGLLAAHQITIYLASCLWTTNILILSCVDCKEMSFILCSNLVIINLSDWCNMNILDLGFGLSEFVVQAVKLQLTRPKFHGWIDKSQVINFPCGNCAILGWLLNEVMESKDCQKHIWITQLRIIEYHCFDALVIVAANLRICSMQTENCRRMLPNQGSLYKLTRWRHKLWRISNSSTTKVTLVVMRSSRTKILTCSLLPQPVDCTLHSNSTCHAAQDTKLSNQKMLFETAWCVNRIAHHKLWHTKICICPWYCVVNFESN